MKPLLLPAFFLSMIGVSIGLALPMFIPLNAEPQYYKYTATITWETEAEELLDELGAIGATEMRTNTIYFREPQTHYDLYVLGHECYHNFRGAYHD